MFLTSKLSKIIVFISILVFVTSSYFIYIMYNKNKVYKGVVLQSVETVSLDTLRSSIIKELEVNGYIESKIQLEFKNAHGSIEQLNKLAREIADSNYDFILTLATPATQAMVRARTTIPHIYSGVSDPYGAGISTEANAHTTGTILPILIKDIFELAEKLTPDVKNFAILYSGFEENAVPTVNDTIKYIQENNLTYDETIVTSEREMIKVANEFIKNTDAFFIPNDNFIQKDIPILTKIAKEANIPVYCALRSNVLNGCLATVAIDLTVLGKITAGFIIEFVNGKSITNIPAQIVTDDYDIYINKNVAESLNITIPQDLKNVILIEDN